MLKKALTLVALLVAFVVGTLLIPSTRTWADEEGSYLYHMFLVNGPAVIYTANTWTGSNGTTHTGLEVNSGKVNAATTLSQRFLGAMATSARPACASGTEGDNIYDSTVHSFAFCNGTSWYKSVDSGSAVTWTAY